MIRQMGHGVAVALAFVLVLILAVRMWHAPSGYEDAAFAWGVGQSLHSSFVAKAPNAQATLSASCNDDAALFSGCEVPLAVPVDGAVLATLESPRVIPTAIFAENLIASAIGVPLRRCAAFPDAVDDAQGDASPTAAGCCSKVEHQAPAAGEASPRTGGCSCDPQECKCA